jgi:hypothetical protein
LSPLNSKIASRACSTAPRRSAATASVGTDGESGAVGSAVSVVLFITDDLASPDLGAATPADYTPAPRT